MIPNDDIEDRIREFFAENFETLRLEGGHSLAPEVKEAALQQVFLYWRKLKDVAEKVTDTEVKLNLPLQKTPAGRVFGIEGVVDIVRENDRTVMYDIKTHDAQAIGQGSPAYEHLVEGFQRQLNVYAHVWKELRGERLDEAAVICTAPPIELREALSGGDEKAIARELAKWDPLIPVPFDSQRVEETIHDFGSVVDAIEAGHFGPRPVDVLQSRLPGMRTLFAVSVCRNCDARFSCSSYRKYALGGHGGAERRFREYYNVLATDAENDDLITAGLDTASDVAKPEDLI
jgi:hypothetical protein